MPFQNIVSPFTPFPSSETFPEVHSFYNRSRRTSDPQIRFTIYQEYLFFIELHAKARNKEYSGRTYLLVLIIKKIYLRYNYKYVLTDHKYSIKYMICTIRLNARMLKIKCFLCEADPMFEVFRKFLMLIGLSSTRLL